MEVLLHKRVITLDQVVRSLELSQVNSGSAASGRLAGSLMQMNKDKSLSLTAIAVLTYQEAVKVVF